MHPSPLSDRRKDNFKQPPVGSTAFSGQTEGPACEQVGRAVFNEAILGAMKGTTRVLATNQLQYARQADIAVLMQVCLVCYLHERVCILLHASRSCACSGVRCTHACAHNMCVAAIPASTLREPETWWLQDGRIAEMGTPTELMGSGGSFAQLMSQAEVG